jgi:hypothetical protein
MRGHTSGQTFVRTICRWNVNSRSLASMDRLQEELSLLRQDRNCHQSIIVVLSSDLEAHVVASTAFLII